MLDVWSSAGKHLVPTVRTGLSVGFQDVNELTWWRSRTSGIFKTWRQNGHRLDASDLRLLILWVLWDAHVNEVAFEMFHNQEGGSCLKACGFHVWINQIQPPKGLHVSSSQLVSCGALEKCCVPSSLEVGIQSQKLRHARVDDVPVVDGETRWTHLLLSFASLAHISTLHDSLYVKARKRCIYS